MNLPPVPEGLKLLIEDSPESVRIEWPVPGGEWRRRGTFVLTALSLASPFGLFFVHWAGFKLGIFPVLLPPLPFKIFLPTLLLCLPFMLLGLLTWLLPLARLTGNGEVVLDGDLLRLHRGGGKHPLRAKRTVIASFEWEGETGIRLRFLQGRRLGFLGLLVRSGLGYPSYRRGQLITLPGPREADWTLEVLEGWRKT